MPSDHHFAQDLRRRRFGLGDIRVQNTVMARTKACAASTRDSDFVVCGELR